MRKLLPCLLIAFALPAFAGELAGVKLPDTAKVGDQTLVLNGLGLRTKAIFKVYVAGLYLPKKSSDAAAILAEDAARRLEMHFVRSVDKGKISEAWDECLTNNSPGAGSEVRAAFGKLPGWMADMASGDAMAFTYAPGKGTEVTVKGQSKGTIEGKPFADAIFGCWLGPTPPNEELKTGILGR
jgi:hypothetical protein